MGSNGRDEVMISGSQEADCSGATTVEIKIKTLDSQTYTMRVDKCVSVPALKEQVATVTGVGSEQQRLICRGRVLKDDQLLSAYHVEDGHTLHLVVRQPISPMLENMPDHHPGSDHFSSVHYSQDSETGPGILVGTFNLSEQGDGVFPEIGQILSAVLGSLGVNNIGSNGEGINNGEVVLERLSGTSQPNGTVDSSRSEPDQSNLRNRSNPLSGGSHRSTSFPLEPQVVPDSLTTLSQYLNHLRNEFSVNVDRHSNNPQASDTQGCGRLESDVSSAASAGQNVVPTPSSLAEILLSTRGILVDQVAECLSQLASQLRGHSTTTNPMTRRNVQLRSLSVGVLLHNLGALLLELGRTTMTLRMGQTSGDAVVNAGPAVFISPSGPTPIMVQPPQLGMSTGAIPSGSLPSAPGFLPRNVDIRIRSGSLAPTVVNQREHNATQQSPEQANPAVSSSVHRSAGRSTSSTRESDVRIVPVRAVVARVPAAVRHTPSGSTHRPLGLLYPVIARVRHLSSRNLNVPSPQSSNQRNNPDAEREPLSESAQQGQNIVHPGRDDSAAATEGAEPRVSDDGLFLSNLLHQVLPLVTQNRGVESHIASTNGANVSDNSNRQTSTTQAQEDADVASSSNRRVRANLPTPPSSKRQKRE